MLAEFTRRLLMLMRRRQFDADLEEETRLHRELREREQIERGLAPQEAHFAAQRRFGNDLVLREESRDMWGWNWLDNSIQDVRYGLRMLARKPGVTGVMIVTLALAIGATTAIFSVVYGVLLRGLPYPRPDRLVSMSEVAADGHLMGFTDPNFADLRAANHTLEGMALAKSWPTTVSGAAGPARLGVALVSSDFFRVMEVAPILGRGFSRDEIQEGGTPVALVSYGYWRQHLSSSTNLSSFKLKAEDHTFSVVGVLPPGFSYPAHTELWVPAELFGEQSPSRTSHNWSAAVARLRDGVSLVQARSDFSVLAHRLHQQYKPEIDMTDLSVTPLRAALTATVRPALLILLAAVGFLLLVGCANVANLLLARAVERERELAVRAALGAGRGRLVRQFLAESLLLSLAGGGVGVLLAIAGVHGLLALAPPNLPRLEEVSVNWGVLGFALGISVLVAVSLATATALRATAVDPQAALAEGSRGAAGSLASNRLARILAGGQMAVTLVLLAGAGLLGRSLLRVLSVDPGFRTSNIVTMELEVPASQPASSIPDALKAIKDTKPANFMSNLFDRLRALPGVEEVGGVSDVPLAQEGDCPDGKFLLLERQPEVDLTKPEDSARLDRLWSTAPGGEADYCVASEGYFKALGIPLLHGRLFDERDTANASHVALVSQSLARTTWPNQDPLGHTIEFGNMDGDMRLFTVVGVVGDVHDRSLEKPPDPIVYVDYRQRLRGERDFTVVMRGDVPPQIMLASARRIIHDLAPDVAPRFQTFQDVFSASLDTRRFNLTLVGVFAVTALLLAAVGIYGVMAYWVGRRTREFGVRMALGARPRNVLKLVLGHSLRTMAVGMLVGLGGAFAFTRAMESLLFGVTASDPLTFAGVALTLGAVAMLATYIPAHRATKVDPMVALRYE
jgi:putative ABC transport system permease protein